VNTNIGVGTMGERIVVPTMVTVGFRDGESSKKRDRQERQREQRAHRLGTYATV